jgi:hypothetical protein
MIHASADQIKQLIVGDPFFLQGVRGAFDQMFGADASRGLDVAKLTKLLEVLPEAIAAHSPFADEADITGAGAVERETLRALHCLTFSARPAQGRA